MTVCIKCTSPRMPIPQMMDKWTTMQDTFALQCIRQYHTASDDKIQINTLNFRLKLRWPALYILCFLSSVFRFTKVFFFKAELLDKYRAPYNQLIH